LRKAISRCEYERLKRPAVAFLVPHLELIAQAIPNISHRSARTKSSNKYVKSAACDLVVADDDRLLARRAAQAMTRHRDHHVAPGALRLPNRSRHAHSEGNNGENHR